MHKTDHHVALVVAVNVVERDAGEGLLRVRNVHREGHAVKQHLARFVPIESRAFGTDGNQHVHALSIVGNGPSRRDHAGGAPVVACHVLRLAVSDHALTQNQRQHQ